MKLWHAAALLVVLGIVYVMVARPAMPKAGNSSNASSSNALLGLLSGGIGLTNRILDKVSAPSASSSDAVYTPGESFEDYTSKLFGPGTEG